MKIDKIENINFNSIWSDSWEDYIPTIDDHVLYDDEYNIIHDLAYHIETLQNKVNEIIDEVNKLKEDKE